jgi:hypothetical protein
MGQHKADGYSEIPIAFALTTPLECGSRRVKAARGVSEYALGSTGWPSRRLLGKSGGPSSMRLGFHVGFGRDDREIP